MHNYIRKFSADCERRPTICKSKKVPSFSLRQQFLLLQAVACFAVTGGAWAQQGTLGVLTYEEYPTYVEITGCNPSATGDLVIPAAINGKPVTAIGSSAFSRLNKLSSVAIPNSVTSIGDSAFYGCSGLKSLTIP